MRLNQQSGDSPQDKISKDLEESPPDNKSPVLPQFALPALSVVSPRRSNRCLSEACSGQTPDFSDLQVPPTTQMTTKTVRHCQTPNSPMLLPARGPSSVTVSPATPSQNRFCTRTSLELATRTSRNSLKRIYESFVSELAARTDS